jgi:hypothetical protein
MKAETGHTPGPWHFSHGRSNHADSTDGVLGAVETVDGWYVCDVWADCVEEHDYEPEANARLIAAAPDLLAALKEMRDACAAAMRVIARHEGQTGEFVLELKGAGVADGFGVRANALIAKAEGKA